MTRIRITVGILAGGLLFVLSGRSVLSTEGVVEGASVSPIAIPSFIGSWARDSSIMQLFPQSNGPSGLINISGFRLQGIANYDSPILKPWAAEIVRRHGELIRSGELAPDAHTSCSPNGVPYSLILRGNVHLLQEPDRVTIIYDNDNQYRTVLLNREHSKDIVPRYYGESVGRYEGDTLVVDTTGIRKTQFSVVDRFGTPHTEELHVIERYKIIEVNGNAALRVDVIVEDPGTFTMPWGGYMVYYNNDDNWWEEGICAENNRSDVWIPTEENFDRLF